MLLITLGACTTVSRKSFSEEYYNLGNIYFELEEYDRAINYYKRALDLEPQFVRAEYNLAFAYIRLGRLREAKELIETLLRGDDSNLLLLESLAYAEYISGNSSAATDIYTQVLEISGARKSTLFNLALIHIQNDENERAEELLQRAYDLDKNDPLILYYYIIIKQALDAVEDVLVELAREYALLNITENDKILEIAQIFEDASYYNEAVILYDKISTGDPLFARALFRKAVIELTAIGEADNGLILLSDALTMNFREAEQLIALYDNQFLLQKKEVLALYEQHSIDLEQLREEVARQAAAREEAQQQQAAISDLLPDATGDAFRDATGDALNNQSDALLPSAPSREEPIVDVTTDASSDGN